MIYFSLWELYTNERRVLLVSWVGGWVGGQEIPGLPTPLRWFITHQYPPEKRCVWLSSPLQCPHSPASYCQGSPCIFFRVPLSLPPPPHTAHSPSITAGRVEHRRSISHAHPATPTFSSPPGTHGSEHNAHSSANQWKHSSGSSFQNALSTWYSWQLAG